MGAEIIRDDLARRSGIVSVLAFALLAGPASAGGRVHHEFGELRSDHGDWLAVCAEAIASGNALEIDHPRGSRRVPLRGMRSRFDAIAAMKSGR